MDGLFSWTKRFSMTIQLIDDEAQAGDDDIEILIAHGWEISKDQREARLYSEGWSSIQVAIASTKVWIDENR
jgi:hypothetical protein